MAASHVFSPTTKHFYPVKLRDAYEKSGTWPADAVEIPDEEIQQWWTVPAGKQRGVGPDGKPVWEDASMPQTATTPEPSIHDRLAALEAEIAVLKAAP